MTQEVRMAFCSTCGKEHSQSAISCPNCGKVFDSKISPKSNTTALLLLIFLGLLGAHRFYVGKTASAVLIMLIGIISTILAIILIGFVGLGLLSIWLTIDFILIVMQKFTDSDKKVLKFK